MKKSHALEYKRLMAQTPKETETGGKS